MPKSRPIKTYADSKNDGQKSPQKESKTGDQLKI